MNVEQVTPITAVKILRSVPFDNTYKDVRDFPDVSSQIQYFTSKKKIEFTNLEPVRISQNAIMVQNPADYYYDCNYIMFQNKNFNTKWFYAFITQIDFVNKNACKIHFEIDVYQTWMFDYTIKPSFVEREHILNDSIGNSLTTESIDVGFYVEEKAKFPSFFNSYKTVIATSYDASETPTGGIFGGISSGLSYFGFDVNTPAEAEEFKKMLSLYDELGKSDAIASIFLIPTAFYTTAPMPKREEYEVPKAITSIGSYTPRNKKLLTYPYNFLSAYTDEGAENIYRYEFFSGASCFFEFSCGMSPNPQILITPANYQNQIINMNEYLTVSGFPQVAWTIDTYRAYLAQNSTSLGMQMFGAVAGIGASVATMNPVGIVGSVIGAGASLNGVVQASMKPPAIKGTQGNSTTVATKNKGVYFVNRHISEEYAKIIDDYFSMFGYSCMQVKVPNTNTRPSWNYVKTTDIKIIGSIPFNDMAKIKQIYNTGVTIWHGDFVGDYGRAN